MKRNLIIALLICMVAISTSFVACEVAVHTHEIKQVVATAPTCETAGNIEYYYCEGCGKYFKDTNYTEITKEETVITALGHDIEHHDEKAPSCTEDGWKAYDTCKREGCTYTTYEAILASHTEVIDKAVKATCTEDGLTEGKHCSVCKQVLVKQEKIDALDHDYKETVVEPTAEADGYVLHKCDRCEDEYKDGYFNYYRFEAENAISNAWGDGTNWLWRWYGKDMASGNCYVGHISDSAISVPGQSYMLFAIDAEEATTASLYVSLGFEGKTAGAIASSAFTVTVNGVDLTKLGNENGQIVAIDASYTPDWENFTLAKLTDEISLNKGINVIVITVNSGATCNMDYIEFRSTSKLTAHTVEHSCESRCPICGKCVDVDCTEYSCLIKCACEKNTYRFEAENASSNAWGADEGGTNQLWKTYDDTNSTSNSWCVEHISNSAIDVPGESWMSFTFTSSAAVNASLSMCISLPEGFIVNTAFTIEINGTVVANVGNSDGKIVSNDSSYVQHWNNYTLCWVTDDVTLREGENVLKLTVMSGATCNMDYIELTTIATISGNR